MSSGSEHRPAQVSKSSAEFIEAFCGETVGSGRLRERRGQGLLSQGGRIWVDSGYFSQQGLSDSPSLLISRERRTEPNSCCGIMGSISLVPQHQECFDHVSPLPSASHQHIPVPSGRLWLGTPAQSQAQVITPMDGRGTTQFRDPIPAPAQK